MCLMAPFSLIVETTGVGRLFAFSSFVVSFFVLLSTLCYKLISLFGDWLSDDFIGSVSSAWLQFVGYVLNFELLYVVFTFYYFVFCTLVISFLVTLSLELCSAFIPEAIEVFRSFLKTLTGDD